MAATFAATLVDEWVRGGVRHAVVCPGSRSTPLALALANAALAGRLELHVRLDERSAAFVALGIGLDSGVPAVLLTTSGTAAAEVHAAVVEADLARVPLIVCTADRPPELQDVGAPQTIRQRGLFGSSVRYEAHPGVPDGVQSGTWRSLAARVLAEATTGPGGAGPVQVNLAFRDPLDGEPGDLPPGRADGGPWHRRAGPSGADGGDLPADVAALMATCARPLVLAGRRCGPGAAALLGAGWPVLADPRSGCRRDEAVVAASDALVRVSSFAAAHEPDLILSLGERPASKVVTAWIDGLAAGGVPHVVFDPFGEWGDPGRGASHFIAGAVSSPALEAIALASARSVDPAWAASWHHAETSAQHAIDRSLDRLRRAGELTEPDIARRLVAAPGVGTIVAASSMPVRDLEWFSVPSPHYPTVHSNRGANGIDGVVSTTAGVTLAQRAAGAVGRPGAVVGLVGDLAFLHDLSALVRPASAGPLALVVVDNDGGGIFSFLPQATSVDERRFELVLGTPQAADPAELARAAGLAVTVVDAPGDLDGGLAELVDRYGSGEGAALICRTDRRRNVEVHALLNEAVAEAIGR